MNTQTLTTQSIDSDQYQSILSKLSTLSPAEAIKVAEEINASNGFSFISEFTIAKWKREAAKMTRIRNELQKGYMQLLAN